MYCIILISMRVVSPMVDCCPFGQEAKWFWISILAIISHACSFCSTSFSRKHVNKYVSQMPLWISGLCVHSFSRKEVGDKFEIVFCSGDRDPGSFKGYYEEQQSKGGHLAEMFTLFLKKHYGEASHKTLGVFFWHSLVLWQPTNLSLGTIPWQTKLIDF